MAIKMVVAFGSNGEIGKNGKLLWDIPGDLKHFKEITSGKIVVMGRKTFDSIPFKNGLPNRWNIVLTREPKKSSLKVIYVNNKEIILKMAQSEDIYIIGGEEIYKEFINHCDYIYATQVFGTFDADTFFPSIERCFRIVSCSETYEENGYGYSFLEYKKIK